MILSFLSRSPLAVQILLYATGLLLISCICLTVAVQIKDAELDAAKARQEALGDKISTQNRAVRTWQSAAELQAHRAAEQFHLAEEARARTAERIRTLAARPVPSACPDAVKWGIDEALKFNRRWAGTADE